MASQHWDPPRAEIKPVSPAGGFLTTETPGKPTVRLPQWLSAWTSHLMRKTKCAWNFTLAPHITCCFVWTIIFTHSRQERKTEKAMAPHSNTLAWKIPWMEEPGGLRSMGFAKSQTWLSDFTFTFHFHALEKEMATHSSVLAWRIPGTEEPGGLPSMGSHRVRHDWSDLAAVAADKKECFLFFLWYLLFNFSYSCIRYL